MGFVVNQAAIFWSIASEISQVKTLSRRISHPQSSVADCVVFNYLFQIDEVLLVALIFAIMPIILVVLSV